MKCNPPDSGFEIWSSCPYLTKSFIPRTPRDISIYITSSPWAVCGSHFYLEYSWFEFYFLMARLSKSKESILLYLPVAGGIHAFPKGIGTKYKQPQITDSISYYDNHYAMCASESSKVWLNCLIFFDLPNSSSPVSWDCRIHQLHLCSKPAPIDIELSHVETTAQKI